MYFKMGGKDIMTHDKKQFVYCEKCHGRLIERASDGSWHFVFGKSKDGDKNKTSPVDIHIKGEVKIKCFRKRCGHWTVLPFIPFFDGTE